MGLLSMWWGLWGKEREYEGRQISKLNSTAEGGVRKKKK